MMVLRGKPRYVKVNLHGRQMAIQPALWLAMVADRTVPSVVSAPLWPMGHR